MIRTADGWKSTENTGAQRSKNINDQSCVVTSDDYNMNPTLQQDPGQEAENTKVAEDTCYARGLFTS
jgi:hypothetical protein